MVWKFGGRRVLALLPYCQTFQPTRSPDPRELDCVSNCNVQGQAWVAWGPMVQLWCERLDGGSASLPGVNLGKQRRREMLPSPRARCQRLGQGQDSIQPAAQSCPTHLAHRAIRLSTTDLQQSHSPVAAARRLKKRCHGRL